MAIEFKPDLSSAHLHALRNQISRHDGILPTFIHPFFTAYPCFQTYSRRDEQTWIGKLNRHPEDSTYFRALIQFLRIYSGPVLIGEEYARVKTLFTVLDQINPQSTVFFYRTDIENPNPHFMDSDVLSRLIEHTWCNKLLIGGQLLLLNSSKIYQDFPIYTVDNCSYGPHGISGCVGAFLVDRLDTDLSKTIQMCFSPMSTIRHRET